MMTEKIPSRFYWALDFLDIRPSDQLLEVGCGHGILLSLVAARLTTGKVTAIDRSGKMVAAASRRNATHIAAGKIAIIEAALATAELGGAEFDKIFAFNINVFWMDPRRELAAVRTLLKPDGALYLFFDPPSPGEAEPTAAKLSANLAANGFAVQNTEIADIGTGKAVRVVAKPA
jgi:SAM-dependent methyltransferase